MRYSVAVRSFIEQMGPEELSAHQSRMRFFCDVLYLVGLQVRQ